MYVCKYIHTYMHTYIHTYLHAHIYIHNIHTHIDKQINLYIYIYSAYIYKYMYRSVYFSMTRTLRCWCILDVVEILAPLHGGLYFVLTSGCDVTVTQTWLVIGQAKRTSMPLLPPQIKRCFWGRIIYHHIRSVPESNMFFWPSTSAFPQQHLPDLERGREVAEQTCWHGAWYMLNWACCTHSCANQAAFAFLA